MVPRKGIGRLSGDEAVRRVYRDGARRASALVVIHACPNGLGSVRLGVSVGRRFGKAVIRNQLRRRLREAVRWYQPLMAADVDLVVVPRTAAAGAAYADLRKGVGAALAASGLLTARTAHMPQP